MKNFVLFGTGSSCYSFLRSFPDLNILFFLDNNKDKHYTLFDGKPILPAESILEMDTSKFEIVIASEFYEEISQQLIELGQIENKNFRSAKYFVIEKADYVIISYMKSGRTWLRYIIAQLYEGIGKLNLQDKLVYTDCYKFAEDFPIIASYHDDNPHLKTSGELKRDKSEYKGKKLIFLVRDPRDLSVSLYYHMKYRSKQFDGSIDSFVELVIPSIVEYYNIWFKNRNFPSDFLLIKYERLKFDSENEVTRVANFLGLNNIPEIIVDAIDKSSFKKMKKYEMENKSSNTQLNKELTKNKNAAKIRKGTVGGYKTELMSETIESINIYIDKNLNSVYGY